jgi:uncharacterized protein (TIGR00255 family)
MPIASMTGFARAEAASGGRHWAWELRSVNGRGLDIRCRLPAGYDALDAPVRAAVAERCRRGNVSVTLTEIREQRSQLRINREALDQVLALVAELKEVAAVAPPRLDGLLALPGVLERQDGEDEPAQHTALLTQRLGEALEGLKSMRLVEGARLAVLIGTHVDEIARLTVAARGAAASQPEQIAQRLRQQLDELLGQLPPPAPDRIVRRSPDGRARDVREELDRLVAHVEASRALIAAGGPIGRKLDFLCQELNREANTLCSKSSDVELTRIGLDLKVAIEQLREQVQNIE